MKKEMKVVILCGGKGTRMGERTEDLPKPLFPIGEKPVLWHIMKIFSSYGYNDFILCTGYGNKHIKKFVDEIEEDNKWKINVVDTGLYSLKSERINMVKDLIKEDNFFLSYGDDLANVDLNKLLEYHNSHGKLATVTGVKMKSPYGIIKFSTDGRINMFEEKPILDKWINGGYMILNKNIFTNSLDEGELEDDILPSLVNEGEVHMYQHDGEWKSMNTLKDNLELNELWNNNKAFWRSW